MCTKHRWKSKVPPPISEEKTSLGNLNSLSFPMTIPSHKVHCVPAEHSLVMSHCITVELVTSSHSTLALSMHGILMLCHISEPQVALVVDIEGGHRDRRLPPARPPSFPGSVLRCVQLNRITVVALLDLEFGVFNA